MVGFALVAPTMAWLKELTFPGYLVAIVVFSGLIGAFLALVPPGPGRRIALPGAWVLAEAFRGVWPFGGVPLSVLATGQVAGPLAGLARLGGTLLIAGVTVAIGVGLAAALRRRWVPAAVALVVSMVLLGVASVAPRGRDTGRRISVAFVQGGGPQGTRAIDTDMRKVFLRHLDASQKVPEGLDLVLWPEDVVDTDGPVLRCSSSPATARRWPPRWPWRSTIRHCALGSGRPDASG
jgi:apolipoprotein N-acyltransferase